MNFKFWLERKKTSLCILAGLCSVSLFIIINSGESKKEINGEYYVIKIKHYGIDAAEIERSISIPLEDALSAIPGIINIQSSSENSQSRVIVRFKKGNKNGLSFTAKNNNSGRYEAVRDAVQRIYETLPSSAQRPEILNSGNSIIPVWAASVYSEDSINKTDNFSVIQTLEKIVKPKLESLEGSGEVIISGAGVKEILIIIDQEKLNQLGLDPYQVSSTLALNDSIFSGGSINWQSREIIVTVDGRYDTLNSNNSADVNSLNNALISAGNGKVIKLSEIGIVTEQERQPDILSRLNGKKTAGIVIMARHGADLRKLSSDIKKELSTLSLPFEFIVLSDLGAEEADAFRSVFKAALSSALMVAVLCLLLNSSNGTQISRRYYHGFFCAMAIPFICLFSIAILSITGFSINRLMFAGISAGIGTAVDAVVLCSEKLRKCHDYEKASKLLSELSAPLIAGTATTVAALIPLSSINDENVRIIAASITVVCISALIISFTFLPPLMLWGMDSKKIINVKPNIIKRILTSESIFKKINISILKFNLSRFFSRFLAIDIKFCIRHPLVIILAASLFTTLAIILLFVKGVEITGNGSEDSLYAQVEFDGSLLAEEADRLLAEYSEDLKQNELIKNIETGARTGSATLLVSFDPQKTKPHIVREYIKQHSIPGGFIFFHENSNRDRYWEIKIYGDEDKKCREIAEELAYLCSVYPNGINPSPRINISHLSKKNTPLIHERVLNFKQGSKKLILNPKRDIFSESKIAFQKAASILRLGVFAPVIYKKNIDSLNFTKGEIDVRLNITTGNKITDYINLSNSNSINNFWNKTKYEILKIPLITKNEESITPLQIESLINCTDDIEPSSIRRSDRRRTASITIVTKPIDPRYLKNELIGIFNEIDLPPGYSIEFDPDAIVQANELSKTIISFILAVLFCFMCIAAINESFIVPLFVLSVIPPSLSIPAIFLGISTNGYTSAAACAFIAVSGMAVNTAVLCMDSIKENYQNYKITSLNIYLAIRKKMPALLSTTSTTVIAAVPFLFLSRGINTLIRTLSVVGVLGISTSLLCSITIIPALLTIKKTI